MALQLWTETPLIRSRYLSQSLGCNVYLKLENLQPSQSFKHRGISLFAHRCVQQYGPQTHLFAASSGNAGYAVACAAKDLGVKSTIYLHIGVGESTIRLMESAEAKVVVVGKTYQDALEEAKKEVERDEHAVLVPSYDHPILWEGHASMVEEMVRQLPCSAVGAGKPDAIFCSVGGGGLLGGILEGTKRVGWGDVPVIAMETHGSNCFYESMLLNRDPSRPLPDNVNRSEENTGIAIASLKQLTSRAASLGATSASAGIIQRALRRDTSGGGKVCCVTVQDEMSMLAGLRFADEHKLLVELACSTTLAPAYSRVSFSRIMRAAGSTRSLEDNLDGKTVIFVVCGGVKISLDDMSMYQAAVDRTLGVPGFKWDIRCDGDKWNVPV